jgi:hypothetical protein
MKRKRRRDGRLGMGGFGGREEGGATVRARAGARGEGVKSAEFQGWESGDDERLQLSLSPRPDTHQEWCGRPPLATLALARGRQTDQQCDCQCAIRARCDVLSCVTIFHPPLAPPPALVLAMLISMWQWGKGTRTVLPD